MALQCGHWTVDGAGATLSGARDTGAAAAATVGRLGTGGLEGAAAATAGFITGADVEETIWAMINRKE